MRVSKAAFFILLLLLMIMTSAPMAQASRLSVIASHGILADVVKNVAGEWADVETLIPTGSDPHGFQPSPGDLIKVAEADLVFINGAGYEESLLDAIMSAGESAHIVNVSECIQVRPFGAGIRPDEDHDDHADEHEDDHADEHDDDHADEHEDDHADEHEDEHEDDHADEHEDDHADDDGDDHADDDGDDHADDHDDDHAHDDQAAMSKSICDVHDVELAELIGEIHGRADYAVLGRAGEADCGAGHGHGDHGHDHGEGACDPHTWMDPHNVVYWALMIRDTLSLEDPANADHYAAAADAYSQEVAALEADFILPLLAELPIEKRILITSHESMGYLATSYSFNLVTTFVAGMATTVEPSAREVAALIDQIQEAGVPAIFADTQISDSIMRAIASEAGVELVGIYSDTLSVDGPADSYLDYMRYNVGTIVAALKG